jgi:tRNA-2-methylthio-N6-dimethylallyladenosine synthase
MIAGDSLKGATYLVRTFGCQMNKHDSERVCGLLDSLGALPVAALEDAEVVVFLTCCVREAADVRLKGQVATLKGLPLPDGCIGRPASRRIVAVGGCIGQRDGAELLKELGNVDVVFGTHNIASLPRLLDEAMQGTGPAVEVLSGSGSGSGGSRAIAAASDLPVSREQHWHAWLPIMTGCNNFCSYCIVPYVRGRESSRRLEDVVAEAERLVADGVREITLLGQNVNSYGRDLYGEPRFAEALRRVAATGIERLRFATSHPKDLSDETIEVFASEAAVMPALHLPVQSGSNRILAEMNRSYSAEHYLGLVQKLRCACKASGKGDVALSTDVIVGFPGEGEADFAATLELVRSVGYAQAFTFIYSRREGTPAAAMRDDTPRELVQERFDALVAVVQEGALACNQRELGCVLPVLFEGTSKRDANMLAGKSPKNQTVHAPLPQGMAAEDFAGQILPVRVKHARTWYLQGELEPPAAQATAAQPPAAQPPAAQAPDEPREAPEA